VAIVGNSGGNSLSATQIRYVGLGQAPDGTNSNVAFPVPVGGTVSSLQVFQNGASGNGNTYTYTLMVNGAAVGALNCAITGNSATSCSSSGTSTLAAGDTVSLRAAPSSNPSTRAVAWSVVITP